MVQSALWQMPLAVLAAGAKNPDSIPIPVVVLTGMALVFAILFILIAVILIQGKFFGSLAKKKEAKAAEAEKAAAATPLPVAAPAAVPAVQDGIPSEVVAAIVAAVSAASQGAYTLRSVTTAPKSRGAWGLAGVIQSTEPF